MRSLFAFLGGALVAFAGLGWYFGWYTITKEPSANGRTHIGIDVDTNKVKDDAARGAKAVSEGINKITNKPDAAKTP